jgi:uncharacterized protein YkwD
MVRGASIVLVLAALALPVGAAAGGDAQATVAREPSLEGLVLQRINEVRASQGLGRLSASSDLSRAALTHSRSMVVSGYFAHESKNGSPFWKRVKSFYAPRAGSWTVGENLAMFGGGSRPDANAIVESWLASPGHRANLLSRRFSEAGIAILHDPAAPGVYGGLSTWVVTLDVGAR